MFQLSYGDFIVLVTCLQCQEIQSQVQKLKCVTLQQAGRGPYSMKEVAPPPNGTIILLLVEPTLFQKRSSSMNHFGKYSFQKNGSQQLLFLGLSRAHKLHRLTAPMDDSSLFVLERAENCVPKKGRWKWKQYHLSFNIEAVGKNIKWLKLGKGTNISGMKIKI